MSCQFCVVASKVAGANSKAVNCIVSCEPNPLEMK